jgi:hypothetical protein
LPAASAHLFSRRPKQGIGKVKRRISEPPDDRPPGRPPAVPLRPLIGELTPPDSAGRIGRPSDYFPKGVGIDSSPTDEPRPPDSYINDAAYNIARVLANSRPNLAGNKHLHYDELVACVCNLGDDQPAVRWALHVLLTGGKLGIQEPAFVVALAELWAWHYGGGELLPPDAAHKPADGKRPCYDRDHQFLQWHEQGLGNAAIRDRWNERHPTAESIGQGRSGSDVVKQGLKKAKAEQKEAGKPKAGRRAKR